MRQLILVFSLICLAIIVAGTVTVYASQIRTVEGIIQRVADDSIRIRGKEYSISGIPLIDPSGENLNKSSLRAGKKVEIFFQDGKITSILIYDDMLE